MVPIRSVESEDFVQPQFSKNVEPDKQSVTPTPRPEEKFLTQDVDPYEDGVLGDDWDFDDDYQNVTTQVSKTLRNQRNRWWSLSITTLFTKPNQYAKNPYLQFDKSINTMVQLELIPLNHDGPEKSMLDKITLQLSPPNLLNWQRSNSVEV